MHPTTGTHLESGHEGESGESRSTGGTQARFREAADEEVGQGSSAPCGKGRLSKLGEDAKRGRKLKPEEYPVASRPRLD
jgi:hypothetical protein